MPGKSLLCYESEVEPFLTRKIGRFDKEHPHQFMYHGGHRGVRYRKTVKPSKYFRKNRKSVSKFS